MVYIRSVFDMLSRAYILSCVFLLGVHCDFYSDLRLFHNLGNLEPLKETWLASPRHADIEREREPLAPDYKDPKPSATEQKPVLQPKPHAALPSSDVSIIPGGVIDVAANPFGGFGDTEFDFSETFGLGSKPFGLGDIFGGFNRNQWWKGSNVCVEREESSDDDDNDEEEKLESKKNETESSVGSDLFSTSISLSNCFEQSNKYECVTKINNHGVVKTFTVRYKCCYGYQKERGSNECTKRGDLKPILETLEDIKATEFRQLIKTTGMEAKFSDGNYSLFVPSDNTLNEYNERISETNNVVDAVRRRRGVKHTLSSRDLVLSHAVDGFVDLTDLGNDEIIRSENDNSTIRINIYPTNTNEKLVTVNCAPVKEPNIFSKNGIVHVTDGIVLPANDDILTIIRNHPRLNNFRKAVELSDIPKRMKIDGHYTVFAPADEAFDKLDSIQKQKIVNGGPCAGSILKHHFTAHTICSSAIVGNATTHNVEGEILNIERNLDDELILEGKSKIMETDIIATNGVIHLIDEIVIPHSGLYIGSVLKNENYTKFQEIIQRAGLEDEINGLQNATVFVPSDRAFESPEAQKLLDNIKDDQDKLKSLVRYHAVQGVLSSGNMNNNVKVTSNDDGNELRINLYSTLPLFTNIVNRATVNCARLVSFDEKACGSVIHEVNKVLVPPSQNILDIIASDDKYSTLRTILEGTEVERILQENNRSMTLLAPTDETFAALDDKDKKLLMENKDKANVVLKNHILTEVLCCSGVGPQSWGFSSFVSTLGNNQVEVGRTGSRIRINRAVVTSCDTLATNGVVHTINKVLLPRPHPAATIGGGFFLFDI